MNIKKGDKVIVISGKDKGKTGEVSRAFPKTNQITIAGMNLKKKHQKARRSGQKGQVIEIPAPFDVSNAMLIDPKSELRTRISVSRDNGKRVRIAKKSGAVI